MANVTPVTPSWTDGWTPVESTTRAWGRTGGTAAAGREEGAMGRQNRSTRGLWGPGVGFGLALVLSLAGWGQAVRVERPPGTVIPDSGTDAQGWQRAGAGQVVLAYTVRNTGDPRWT